MAFLDLSRQFPGQHEANEAAMESSPFVDVVDVSPGPKQLFDITKMPPTGAEWLEVMGTAYMVAIILSTIAVIAVVVLSAVHLYFIHYYISNETIQDNLYYLALLFPIMSIGSLMAMYMPRCAILMFTVCLTYLMLCVLMVVSLLRHLFGSMEAFSEYMEERSKKISVSTPPLCCCCKCCPMITPTPLNLRKIEWMVVQSPIVRIVIEILLIVVFLEQTGYETLTMVGQILEACSMLSATWGCQMMIIATQERFQAERFGTIFKFVNNTQVFVTLQKLIFDLVGKYNGFDNSTILTPVLKAFFWNNFTMTLEMCLMAVLATILVSPKRSTLFDRYENRQRYELEKRRPVPTQPEDNV